MVELAPKPKPKTNLASKALFCISLVLLIATLGLLVFLHFYLVPVKEKEMQSLQDKLTQQQTPLKKLEKELSEEQARINTLSLLINYRKKATPFLAAVEQSTHKNIKWNSLQVDTEKGSLSLSGQAIDLPSLTQELMYLNRSSNFSQVELSNIAIKEGLVSFKLSLQVAPNLFK
ncbi:hypothetical protein J7K24_01565 [bacterium]|nr:hypothetical protein [bacterium]